MFATFGRGHQRVTLIERLESKLLTIAKVRWSALSSELKFNEMMCSELARLISCCIFFQICGANVNRFDETFTKEEVMRKDQDGIISFKE